MEQKEDILNNVLAVFFPSNYKEWRLQLSNFKKHATVLWKYKISPHDLVQSWKFLRESVMCNLQINVANKSDNQIKRSSQNDLSTKRFGSQLQFTDTTNDNVWVLLCYYRNRHWAHRRNTIIVMNIKPQSTVSADLMLNVSLHGEQISVIRMSSVCA